MALLYVWSTLGRFCRVHYSIQYTVSQPMLMLFTQVFGAVSNARWEYATGHLNRAVNQPNAQRT